MNDDLWSLPGWVHHSSLGASELTNRIWAEQRKGVCARFVRGTRMPTEDALFDEWSAALQFPYYFGSNWPAFAECCADLDWLEGNQILVAILDADVIAATDATLKSLVTALSNAHDELAQSNEWRSQRIFKLVLQVRGNRSAILERLLGIGVSSTPLG